MQISLQNRVTNTENNIWLPKKETMKGEIHCLGLTDTVIYKINRDLLYSITVTYNEKRIEKKGIDIFIFESLC